MAEANPRKDFRFRIEIAGVDQLLIQEATLPDFELAEIMHGGDINTPDRKTPGKIKIGDFVVKKIKPSGLADNWVWNWLNDAASLPRIGYARFAYLKEMDETGLRTIAIYDLGEIWPKKVAGQTYKRAGDGDNVIEEITFSVSDFTKLPDIGL